MHWYFAFYLNSIYYAHHLHNKFFQVEMGTVSPLPLTLEVAGWPWCYPGHCWVRSLEPCAVVWRHNTARLVQSLSPRSEWLVLSSTVRKTQDALLEGSAERSLPHQVVRATSYGPGDLETQFINRIIHIVTGYIKMEKNEQVNVLPCWL